MAEDVTLSLPDGWTEARFERGTYGPEGHEGFVAALRGTDATAEVLPVRYRREDGAETVTALVEDWGAGRSDPSVPPDDAGPLTAFALRLTYTPFESEREEVVCVAADAGDALAVAVWLADAAPDARALRRHVDAHAGSGSPTDAALSDDDVLAAALADAPERCVFTGTTTSSHGIRLPYRYAPLLSGARRTDPGVPRFPSTVRALAGAVSHAAWEEHGLDAVDLSPSVDRDAAGEYRLDQAVADAVAGTDFEAYALRRPGDDG